MNIDQRLIRVLIKATLKYVSTIAFDASIGDLEYNPTDRFVKTSAERKQIMRAVNHFTEMAKPTKHMRMEIARHQPKVRPEK